MIFENREQAGDLLTQKLKKIVSGEDFVVVALLRGGIILGKRISDYFKVPLKPLAIKKVGAPNNSELAIGAVTYDRTNYFDKDLIQHLSVNKDYMKNALEVKRKEAEALQKRFKNKISLKGKRVIIVDDGIATGTTAICASIYARKEKAKRIILATPLIAKDTLRNIKNYFDRIVSLKIADNLISVSQFYKHFPQVEDNDVVEILNRK